MSLIPGSRLYIVVNQLDIEMYFTQTVRLLGYTRDISTRKVVMFMAGKENCTDNVFNRLIVFYFA